MGRRRRGGFEWVGCVGCVHSFEMGVEGKGLKMEVYVDN